MLRSWFSGWKLHLILIEWCTLSWVEWCDFDASRYLKKKTQNREEANRIIGLLMKLVIFSQLKFKRLKEVLKEQSYQTQIKEIWRDNPKQTKPPQGYLPNHAILFLFFLQKVPFVWILSEKWKVPYFYLKHKENICGSFYYRIHSIYHDKEAQPTAFYIIMSQSSGGGRQSVARAREVLWNLPFPPVLLHYGLWQ